MEKKTHIAFTFTLIYWTNYLLRLYWVDNYFASLYVWIVSSFPIISIPYQALVTTLPDADSYSTRLKKTILSPAVWIVQIFTSHRWATHDIRWIAIFWLILYWLFLLWTNIIVLAIMSFIMVTTTIIMIDNLKIWFWSLLSIKTSFPEYIFTFIIILFFPILLIPEVYTIFLISLFFWYIWHLLWDLPSIEWLNLFIFKKLKIQLPFAFKVWWKFERFIIFPLLIFVLFMIIYSDRTFWIEKFIYDIILTKEQYIEIIKNPGILFQDLENIKDKISNLRIFLENIPYLSK